MQLKYFCKHTVITGTLVIWIIKWLIRPYIHFPQPMIFLLGIAPNLLGSFLLPFGAYWLLRKYIDLLNDHYLRLFCIVCFILLCINELLQLIPYFGRTFDYYDIAASAAGLLGSYFLCGKFLFKRLATYP